MFNSGGLLYLLLLASKLRQNGNDCSNQVSRDHNFHLIPECFLAVVKPANQILFLLLSYYAVTKSVEDNVEIKLLNMAERMEVS